MYIHLNVWLIPRRSGSSWVPLYQIMNAFFALSLLIVGADVVIALTLLFGAYRTFHNRPSAVPNPSRVIVIFGVLFFAWLATALFLGSSGIFRSAFSQPVPYIAVAILAPILIGATIFKCSKSLRALIDAVPQSWLVGVQLYRILGATFIALYAAGGLPAVFALPAGWGDVFIGIAAVFVSIAYARSQSAGLVALWNFLGITDLILAIGIGFLSAPSKFQIFSLKEPNVMIGSFPLVMIPVFAVPLSILLHFASLTKLRRERRLAIDEVGPVLV